MKHVDVAIIGAGPAGSSAAICLARKAYSVALIDRATFPREKLCGDFLNPVNWPVLRELDVEGELLSRPHKKVATFRFTSFSGEETEIPLSTRNGEAIFGLGLRRSDLDHVLLRKAESAGAAVLQGCRVRELKRGSRRWFLQFDQGGVIGEISAEMLIGADGRNSWVAHRLGMAGGTAMQGRSIGFQVHLKSSKGIGSKVEIHLFPGGYAGIVGLDGDTMNLCFALDKNRRPDPRPVRFLPDSCLAQNPWLKEILGNERVSEIRSTYPVYFPPRRAYDDGVVLVGDAARVNEPVTGEGIYFAMKSGFFAADAMHQAFRKGDFSARRLSVYARHCQHAFRLRRAMNSFIRSLIYRPAVLSPLIRFSSKRRRVLDSVVHAICLP